MAHPLYFWDHDHPDSGRNGGEESRRSRSNAFEAQAAVCLSRYLLQQGYGAEVSGGLAA
jgi:hypothetical protein